MTTYDPIYMTINDKPSAILSGFDEILKRREIVLQAYSRRIWAPLGLFLAGFPCLFIDLFFGLLGYKVLLFTFLAAFLWVAALVVLLINKKNKLPHLSPGFFAAREVLYTLRDDIDPRRTFFGYMDLMGTRQPEKVARESSNAIGLVTQFFRDEWLNLKAKLYDGNMLRLSVVKREKVRKGYYKRSQISGKNKWKPPKEKGNFSELKIQITLNPDVYEPNIIHSLREGAKVGDYTIMKVVNDPGSLTLVAKTQTPDVTAADILAVLRNSYDMLKRKE